MSERDRAEEYHERKYQAEKLEREIRSTQGWCDIAYLTAQIDARQKAERQAREREQWVRQKESTLKEMYAEDPWHLMLTAIEIHHSDAEVQLKRLLGTVEVALDPMKEVREANELVDRIFNSGEHPGGPSNSGDVPPAQSKRGRLNLVELKMEEKRRATEVRIEAHKSHLRLIASSISHLIAIRAAWAG